jgi:hypothetical protein
MTAERTADPSDQASQWEEAYRAAAVATRKPEGPRPNGFCHNCGAPVKPGLRWCDVACRDDWERLQPRPEIDA